MFCSGYLFIFTIFAVMTYLKVVKLQIGFTKMPMGAHYCDVLQFLFRSVHTACA